MLVWTAPFVLDKPWSVIDGGGGVTFTFIAWEPPLACLEWKMLITDDREVNEKGSCLKISFIFVLKIELWHLCKSLLPSPKGLSIYFYVVSPPSKNKHQKLSRAQRS